jgi:PST family polysaccharide transporter
MPATVGCALLADDIVLVFLGPKWHDVASIFRLLAPAILAFGFTNPCIWLMLAGGRAGRALKLSLVVTPALILSYILGLGHGPQGVAIGFSVTMVLAVVPVVLWATRGTAVTMRDILRAVAPAAISIATGAVALLIARPMLAALQPAFVRLVAESTVLFGVYLFTLLFVMNQKSVYLALLRDTGLRGGDSRGTAGS